MARLTNMKNKTITYVRYLYTHRGFCRQYYQQTTRPYKLYCRQEDSPKSFHWYECAKDGEPSHEIPAPTIVFKCPKLKRQKLNVADALGVA